MAQDALFPKDAAIRRSGQRHPDWMRDRVLRATASLRPLHIARISLLSVLFLSGMSLSAVSFAEPSENSSSERTTLSDLMQQSLQAQGIHYGQSIEFDAAVSVNAQSYLEGHSPSSTSPAREASSASSSSSATSGASGSSAYASEAQTAPQSAGSAVAGPEGAVMEHGHEGEVPVVSSMEALEAFKGRAVIVPKRAGSGVHHQGKDGKEQSFSHSRTYEVSNPNFARHYSYDFVKDSSAHAHGPTARHRELHTVAEHMAFHGTMPREEHLTEAQATYLRQSELLRDVLSMPQIAVALGSVVDRHEDGNMSRPINASGLFDLTNPAGAEAYCVLSQEQIDLQAELSRYRAESIERQAEQALIDADYHSELPIGMQRHIQEEADMREAATVAIEADLRQPKPSDTELHLRHMHLQEQILSDLTEASERHDSEFRFHDLGARYQFILQRGYDLAQVVLDMAMSLDTQRLTLHALEAVDLPEIFNDFYLPSLFGDHESYEPLEAEQLPLSPLMDLHEQESLSRATLMQHNRLLSPNLLFGNYLQPHDGHFAAKTPFVSNKSHTGDELGFDSGAAGEVAGGSSSSAAATAGAAAAHRHVDSIDLMLSEQVGILEQVSPDIERLSQKQELMEANIFFMPPPRERPRKGSILKEDLKMRQELYRSGMTAQMWLRHRQHAQQKTRDEEERNDTFADNIGDVIYYSQLYLNHKLDYSKLGIFIVGLEDATILELQRTNAEHQALKRRSEYLKYVHLKSNLFDHSILSPEK